MRSSKTLKTKPLPVPNHKLNNLVSKIFLFSCQDIDFGHMLGNWKHKFGVKRERSRMHFTKAMKHAIKHSWSFPNGVKKTSKRTSLISIGEANLSYAQSAGSSPRSLQETNLYPHFLDLCDFAFNEIRHRHRLLSTLLILMVPAGMPELMDEEEASYLVEHFLKSKTTSTKNFKRN